MRSCSSFPDKDADGYFISPLVETSPANAVAISVSYKLKDCSPSDFFGAKCKMFFEVYISRRSAPFPPDSNFRPDPMHVKYEYLGKFGNSSVLPDPIAVGFSDTFTLNVSVDLKGHGGIFIAFRDRGACVVVSSVSVSYKKCPAAGGDLIKFNAVPAPSSSSHSLRVNGTCSDFSIPMISAANNYMKCFANGTATVYGGCKCQAGYEMASATSCTGKLNTLFGSLQTIMRSFYSCMASTNEMMGYQNEGYGDEEGAPFSLAYDACPNPMFASASIEFLTISNGSFVNEYPQEIVEVYSISVFGLECLPPSLLGM